jgi:phospholipid-translocating ATPase
VLSYRFIWKVAFIVAISSMPLYVLKVLQHKFAPAAYAKVAQY